MRDSRKNPVILHQKSENEFCDMDVKRSKDDGKKCTVTVSSTYIHI